MNKKYEEFVGCLRDELMKCLGLGEKQIYFEERDENGMTPNGDRLFVEVRASAAGKEVLKETIMEATPEEDFLTDKIYKYSRKTGTFWIYKDDTFFNLGVPEFLEPERKM